MDLAAFSDIEFVGIAAERQVVIDPARHGRRDSCSGSSSISLNSVGSEVERYDQSLRASALDIREVYFVTPTSPSALVVDFVPDDLASAIDDGRDGSGNGANLAAISSRSSDPSAVLPLERYLGATQPHERVAVSMAIGWPCDPLAGSAPDFRRSHAPSPSTRRGLEVSGNQIDVAGDATAARSVADPDDDDRQDQLKTYSLKRWFGSSMEKTQELAVALQQTTRVQPRRPTTASRQDPAPSSGPKPSGGEADHGSPVSSISLGRIEPTTAPDANGDENIDADLQAFTAAFKENKQRIAVAQPRAYRPARKRRKNQDDHGHARSSRPRTQPSD